MMKSVDQNVRSADKGEGLKVMQEEKQSRSKQGRGSCSSDGSATFNGEMRSQKSPKKKS